MKRTWIAPLFAVGIFLLLMELLIHLGVIAIFILPKPSQVFLCFVENREALLSASLETATATILGLVISVSVGVVLALLQSLSKNFSQALLPFATFFQTVPIVAIAPLLVIWFGFGLQTVVASAAIVSFFPILANLMMGLNQADPHLVEIFKLLRASRLQILLKLKIPSSLGYFFSGLRVAAGLAVIGAIVGEFIAGGGLGSLIDSARTQQRLDLVFAAVILSSLLGLILIALVKMLSTILLRQRPYFQEAP